MLSLPSQAPASSELWVRGPGVSAQLSRWFALPFNFFLSFFPFYIRQL